MAADQRQGVIFCQAAGDVLVVGFPGGGQKYHVGPAAALGGALGLDLPQAVGDGLGVQHHAAAAAVGVVVGLLLLVFGVVPDLVAVGLEQMFGRRPPQYAGVQKTVAQFREQRHDVNAHGGHSSSPFTGGSNMPGMGVTRIFRASMSMVWTNSGTTGIMWSAPAASRTV